MRPRNRVAERSRKALVLTGTLAACLVAAAPAGAGPSEAPRGAHAAALYTARLKDSYFSPSSIRARGKATVRFVWAGKLAHNLVGRGIPKSYSSAAVRHKPLTRTYGRGTYTFSCTIHPGMALKLRVR
jgi:plastocyanin